MIKYLTCPPKTLSETLAPSDMLLKVGDILGFDGVDITSAVIGDKLYASLQDSTGSVLELIELDPTTIANYNSTGITILKRGLELNGGTSEVSDNKLTWVKGISFINFGTDTPQLLALHVRLYDDQTIDGVKSFNDFPKKIGSTTATSADEFITKAQLDAAILGSAVYDQQMISGTAGEALTAGNLVYFKEADQKWWKADADLVATIGEVKLGFAQSSVSANASVNIVLDGLDKNQAGLTIGAKYYASSVAGAITTTPPSNTNTVFLGWAFTSTVLLFSARGIDMPSADEKDALAGYSGAQPNNTNKYEDYADTTDGNTTDQSQTTQNATQPVGEADLTTKINKIAQSFIPGKSPIVSVDFYKAADSGSFTGTVKFAIQLDNGSDQPDGTDLASVTINNAAWLALSAGINTATFSSSFKPQLGKKYWIVITPSTADNTNKINIGTNSAGGYANGSVKRYNIIDGWVAIATIDLYFAIKTNNNNKLVRTGSDGKLPALDASQLSGISVKTSLVYGEDIASGIPVFIGHGKSEKRVIAGNHLTDSSTVTVQTTSNNRVGQTFRSKVGRMTGFRLHLQMSAARTLTWGIFATSGGLPTGAALASGNTGSISKDSIEVTLGTPLTLTPDTEYAITLYADGANVSWYKWQASTVTNTYESTDYIDAYPNGTRITESAGTWSVASTTDDFCFDIIDERTYTENYAWIASGISSSQISSLSGNPFHSGLRTQCNKVFGFTAETKLSGETGSITYQGVVTPNVYGTMATSVSEYVEQQQSNFSNILFQTDSTNKWRVQTFQTGETDVITAVEFYLGKTGTPGDNLTVYICEIDENTGKVQQDGSSTGLPNNFLASVTFSNADVPGTQWVKKTLATPLKVRPRTRYAFVLRYGTYAPTNYFSVYGTTTEAYKGCMDYNSGATSLSLFTTQPLAFKIYTTTHRYGYQGDYVYLGKSAGYTSFKEPVSDLMTKVGEILNSTQMTFETKFKGELIKRTSYNGGSGSGTFYLPIERNARKVLVVQQFSKYEVLLGETNNMAQPVRSDGTSAPGTASVNHFGHTMLMITFDGTYTSGTPLSIYQYN